MGEPNRFWAAVDYRNIQWYASWSLGKEILNNATPIHNVAILWDLEKGYHVMSIYSVDLFKGLMALGEIAKAATRETFQTFPGKRVAGFCLLTSHSIRPFRCPTFSLNFSSKFD
jgi:hypothetical protein